MSGRVWLVVRAAFLVAVVAGAWGSWRHSGDEVVAAAGQVSAGQVALAGALVIIGLLGTGGVWRVALESFMATRAPWSVVPPFFVAQLGKYVPGLVWSFAAQAALGTRQGMPPRVPVTAAVMFLGAHVASGLMLTGLLGWATSLPVLVVTASLLVGVIGLLPIVHRALGARVAGERCGWSPRSSLVAAGVMTPVWLLYGGALAVLAPPGSVEGALTLVCAFAVAHAVGAAVPVAPAGLGAREGVLVLLLAPTLGAPTASMLAVLARLLHFLADFALGGAGWLTMRRSHASATAEAVPRGD